MNGVSIFLVVVAGVCAVVAIERMVRCAQKDREIERQQDRIGGLLSDCMRLSVKAGEQKPIGEMVIRLDASALTRDVENANAVIAHADAKAKELQAALNALGPYINKPRGK
jgi:hypothetical protein